jgi:RNA polymerase sigma factor (sigma-70 family)
VETAARSCDSSPRPWACERHPAWYARGRMDDAADNERLVRLIAAAMLAVIQAARGGKIEDAARLDRFVLGTCRNIALRMQKARARAEPTDMEKLDASFVEPELGAVDIGALLRCLSELEPRARRVVYLSFHDEKTADEIASVFSTTAGNVRVLRHRAMTQLRRCMDDCAEGGR